MMTFSRAVPILMAAFWLTGAGEPPPPPGDTTVVAARGDLHMTRADLQDALNLMDANTRAQVTASPQALAKFAKDRLLNLSVLAEARTNGWDSKPDVQKRIAETTNSVIVQTWLASKVQPDPAFPSEAEVTAAYDANRSHLIAPRQFHVAQIVLLVKQGASAQEDEETHRKAVELRTQVMRPRADFAEIAKKSSQEQASAAKGGDVGWLREPDMLQAARDAVAAMSDGAVSQPIRMPDGWHILKLLEARAAGPVPLLDAKPQLVQALRQARAQAQIQAYVDDMLKSKPIDVNEIELSKSVVAPK